MSRMTTAVTAVALLGGCAEPTDQDTAESLAAWYEEAGVVEVVAGVEVGGTIIACSEWGPAGRPPDVPITVDLVFSALVTPEHPGPAPASVEAVREQGGTIVREFSFPAVRATLRPAAIERLVGSSLGTVANVALAVPPSGASNFRAALVMEPGSAARVSAAVEEVGGVVTYYRPGSTGLTAVLPSESLLTLARTSGVLSVEVASVGCLF